MKQTKYVLLLAVSIFISSYTHAQDRPFLFTFTNENYQGRSTFLRYETAYGQNTFEPVGVDALEQNVGFQSNIGKYFTILDHSGLAFKNGPVMFVQRTELMANILNTNDSRILDLSAGMGYLHEYSGTGVLISRLMVGRQFTSWQVYSNLVFEHAFSVDRDPIDLTSTIGFSYDLFDSVRLGIEAVGQDIEGFWETDEAEGGATLYFGPSLNFTIPGTTLNITTGGGEIIRATHSIRNSEALRELPAGKGNGFILRNIISIGL
jgi:hypothetical protein